MLLQFRRSPGVLPACRHIREQSASAEARFHAACALREAVLREWASLPAEERTALRTYVLQYVLLHAAEPQLQVVRSILEGTLAVMLKRGWMDADEQARAAFFQVRGFAILPCVHCQQQPGMRLATVPKQCAAGVQQLAAIVLACQRAVMLSVTMLAWYIYLHCRSSARPARPSAVQQRRLLGCR